MAKKMILLSIVYMMVVMISVQASSTLLKSGHYNSTASSRYKKLSTLWRKVKTHSNCQPSAKQNCLPLTIAVNQLATLKPLELADTIIAAYPASNTFVKSQLAMLMSESTIFTSKDQAQQIEAPNENNLHKIEHFLVEQHLFCSGCKNNHSTLADFPRYTFKRQGHKIELIKEFHHIKTVETTISH